MMPRRSFFICRTAATTPSQPLHAAIWNSWARPHPSSETSDGFYSLNKNPLAVARGKKQSGNVANLPRRASHLQPDSLWAPSKAQTQLFRLHSAFDSRSPEWRKNVQKHLRRLHAE